VHRDVKPANILVRSDGVVKVVDFGIAHLDASTEMTRTGQVLGTLAYMSPEQIKGEHTDASTDVYSLGVTLFQAITGTLPFSSSAPYERVFKAPPDVMAACPGLPPDVGRIVNRCLERKPAARYRNAGELLADLRTAAPSPGPDA
jgi:serine/threonine-protein kinase